MIYTTPTLCTNIGPPFVVGFTICDKSSVLIKVMYYWLIQNDAVIYSLL